LSDFALRFGLALAVVTVERNIEAFRLEFRRSIDAAQAATIKSIAKTIHDNIFSVIKPIDSSVRDLDARLARQEQQHADATAAHMTGTQILVRLARLEERADASAIQDLDARLARLEEHTDATAIQKLDRRLAKLEERTDAAAIQDLDVRLVKLKEHTETSASQIAVNCLLNQRKLIAERRQVLLLIAERRQVSL
jgi:hypothetical protein